MTRNKSNAAPARQGVKRTPIIVRYLPIALAAMADALVAGNESGAEEVKAEIEQLLKEAFRGVAYAAMLALVQREWQLAQRFARPQIIDTAVDELDLFNASRIHDGPPIIDHE